MSHILPRSADNSYRGYRAALGIFVFVVIVKAGISLGTMFNGHTAAASADGIPLDSYGPAAAQTVLSLFALLDLAQLMICIVSAVVLIRYRTLVPLMFAVLLVYQLGWATTLHFLLIARVGSPPGFGINIVLLVLMILGSDCRSSNARADDIGLIDLRPID